MLKMNREAIARAGILLGPALALLVATLLPEASGPGETGLTAAGRATLATAVWMATWWLTEAVPLAATALLPVVLFPLLGIADIGASAAPYANPLIFLFLGGFLLGLGIQRFGLHRRIALRVLLLVGSSPRALIGGFMLAAALLSMWISNTATAIMMLPIGASVLKMLEEHRSREAGASCTPAQMRAFGTALVLGIAYACSIGGTGTLVGTPPNLVLAAFVKAHYGVDLSMVGWLAIGLPLVALLLPLSWWYLTRIAFRVPATPFPCGRALLQAELAGLGAMSRGERVTLVVFLLTASGWLLRPQLVSWTGIAGITDAGIAMFGALSLFVIPVDREAREFALDWETARRVPWEVLILFGGGLSLAAAIAANGVDAFLASGLAGLGGVPPWVLALAVATLVVFLTEITSNTAVTTTLMPVLAATAIATESSPSTTPPNAIVFSSGYVTVGQMAKAGLGLNLIAILVVTAVVSLGARLVLS